jgi:hypothetical protein
MSPIEMTAAGVAVILLAVWARRTDLMGWPSGTNIALGVIILLLAATHRTVGVDPLILFWMILLIGVTAAIAALWSILYRHDTGQAAHSR